MCCCMAVACVKGGLAGVVLRVLVRGRKQAGRHVCINLQSWVVVLALCTCWLQHLWEGLPEAVRVGPPGDVGGLAGAGPGTMQSGFAMCLLRFARHDAIGAALYPAITNCSYSGCRPLCHMDVAGGWHCSLSACVRRPQCHVLLLACESAAMAPVTIWCVAVALDLG